MAEISTHPIWKPDTGIIQIEGDLHNLSASQIPGIKAIWAEQRARLQDTAQLSEFTEKLNREWAIETGAIENLYEIGRSGTHALIEKGFHVGLLDHGSTNKPREYVIQLLCDQKDALEGVFGFVKSERELSTAYIKELHAALLRSQSSTEAVDAQGRSVEIPLNRGEWKSQANFPVRDGIIYKYCSPEHVAAEMDRLIEMHKDHVANSVPSEVQAAWLHHRFTQIHPFQDGNGRVARALASLVLIKDGLFSLVVTREDKPRYLESLEKADQGDLKPLTELFTRMQITQFRKASRISEALLGDEDVDAVLGGLKRAAEEIAADQVASLQTVFELAYVLEEDLNDRLEEIASEVTAALEKVAPGARGFVSRSSQHTDHYFRAQIIENAKHHIGYFADTSICRSWVALNLRWSRSCKVVFAIHGIGKPFNGSLICAPFLEFKDVDEEGQTRPTQVPIAEEGLVFFYNEDKDKLVSRFESWREGVLKVALKEITLNL